MDTNSLKYTQDHEWIRVEGEFAYVGITDFAQGVHTQKKVQKSLKMPKSQIFKSNPPTLDELFLGQTFFP